jgi:hypothetical protein
MTAISITAADVHAVKIIEEITLPAGEAITAGEVVRVTAATGKWEHDKADESATVTALRGVAIEDRRNTNSPVTAVRRGILDVGDALAALNYGAPVYLGDTDGVMDTAEGTNVVIIGWVYPNFGVSAGTAADKLLYVDVGNQPAVASS